MIESLHEIYGIFTNFTEVCGIGNIFVVHILFGELTEIIKLMERWLRDKDADKSIICIRLQCRRPFDHQPSPCKLDRFYQVSSTYYQVDLKVHSTKIPRFRLTLAFFIICFFPAVLFVNGICWLHFWHQLSVLGGFYIISNKSHGSRWLNESFCNSCQCG